MARVFFLSNIPTPYQLDFLDRLAAKHDVRAIFLWSKEKNLDWHLCGRDWLEVVDRRSWHATASKLVALLWYWRPDAILIGGHRLPFSGFVKWFGMLLGARAAYWLEKPLPAGCLKKTLRHAVWAVRLPFAYGVAALGRRAVATYAPFSRRTLNLPYSIDVQRYATVRNVIAERRVRFLFVGQLICRKGVAELLEAFAMLPADNAELTIAGSGELEGLVESYIERCRNIHFLGFVGPKQLPGLYCSHDVFVAPSRHDGWAVVVCEAMAAGMPVIGTEATGAFAEFIEHQRNGYRCDVTAVSIQDGLRYYCENKSLILCHGEVNRRLVEESCANASIAAATLSAWFELM